MKVRFFEIELTDKNIEKWFPEIEAKIGRRLPLHSPPLEGGDSPDENDTPGPHYYLCIPSAFIHLVEPYGRILGPFVEKEVEESMVNENYEIDYWGPGCDPELILTRPMMEVRFFEIELTDKNIEKWFPEIEAKIGRRLPLHSPPLEGGVWPDKNNVMQCWPRNHYYLCIPSEFIHLVEPFGKILGPFVEKEVEESKVNERYKIHYWGPGCNPELRPI